MFPGSCEHKSFSQQPASRFHCMSHCCCITSRSCCVLAFTQCIEMPQQSCTKSGIYRLNRTWMDLEVFQTSSNNRKLGVCAVFRIDWKLRQHAVTTFRLVPFSRPTLWPSLCSAPPTLALQLGQALLGTWCTSYQWVKAKSTRNHGFYPQNFAGSCILNQICCLESCLYESPYLIVRFRRVYKSGCKSATATVTGLVWFSISSLHMSEFHFLLSNHLFIHLPQLFVCLQDWPWPRMFLVNYYPLSIFIYIHQCSLNYHSDILCSCMVFSFSLTEIYQWFTQLLRCLDHRARLPLFHSTTPSGKGHLPLRPAGGDGGVLETKRSVKGGTCTPF